MSPLRDQRQWSANVSFDDYSALALQQRLIGLRYWLGPVDGRFGELARQAAYAFEKTQALPVGRPH